MLFDTFIGSDNAIDIRYRTDGSAFNLRRFQVKIKVKTDMINLFLFADDCTLKATTKSNKWNSVDKFSMACDNFGLTFSTKKTVVMHQQAPGKPYVEPITIKGQRLKVVEKFTSLGSTVSTSIVMNEKVNTRLAKASADFVQLNRNVWNRRGISEATKIKVYQAVVLTTFLLGCETWTTYQRHLKKLNHFHTTCLRKILGITWQKHIPDTEFLNQASLPCIYTSWCNHSLGWSCCSHERSSPTEEIAQRRTVSGQALLRRPENKTLLRHTEGLHEIFRYQH